MTIDFLLEGLKPTRFNSVQDRLYIDYDWEADALLDSYFVVKCWRALDPTTWTEIYNQMWVKDYAAAKMKAVGSEYDQIPKRPDAGGVTLNGEMIYNDAVQEQRFG